MSNFGGRLLAGVLFLAVIAPYCSAMASALPETVVVEANPIKHTLVSLSQHAVSVEVPPMPSGTILTLQQVDLAAVAPLTGSNRLVGTPFRFLVHQGGVRLPELDTEAMFGVMVPHTGVLPSALGLYHYHEAEAAWQRVPAEFDAPTSTLGGRFTRTGLFALLVDTTPPEALTNIGVAVDGQVVTLSGRAEPFATIQLFAGDQFLGAVQGDLRGHYIFRRSFLPAQYVLRLRQLDQAGNQSEQSLAITVTTDWLVHIELTPGSTQATLNRTLLMLDIPPRIVQGRTMVPVRFVAEALGATVTWHEAANSVTVSYGAYSIHLTISSPVATVNDNHITLDVAPFVERGRALVPLRFLAEALGFEVLWHSYTQRIDIRK